MTTHPLNIILFNPDEWRADVAGDYGLVEKWPSALDDTITRVPFVVRLPGGYTRPWVGAAYLAPPPPGPSG